MHNFWVVYLGCICSCCFTLMPMSNSCKYPDPRLPGWQRGEASPSPPGPWCTACLQHNPPRGRGGGVQRYRAYKGCAECLDVRHSHAGLQYMESICWVDAVPSHAATVQPYPGPSAADATVSPYERTGQGAGMCCTILRCTPQNCCSTPQTHCHLATWHHCHSAG